MKKLTIVMAVLATLIGNAGYAQNSNRGKTTGNGAQSGGSYVADNFAWGLGLGALVVLGVVVGVTAGAAASSASSFSH